MSLHTQDLIALAQSGDQDARARLVEENTGLIWSVARRYFGRGVESDDLYQLGCLGFLKAVDGFDLTYGTRFSTYAVPKIAGEIRRFLRDDGTVKVSRSLKERSNAIKRTRQQLMNRWNREPALSELAAELDLTVEEIAEAELATQEAESIHREAGEEGFTLEDVLTEGSMEEQLVEIIALRDAVGKLPDREKTVICLRYYRGLTQEQTARIIGVSQVQVSRVEKKALNLLKGHL